MRGREVFFALDKVKFLDRRSENRQERLIFWTMPRALCKVRMRKEMHRAFSRFCPRILDFRGFFALISFLERKNYESAKQDLE